jgi:hypothetical protein
MMSRLLMRVEQAKVVAATNLLDCCRQSTSHARRRCPAAAETSSGALAVSGDLRRATPNSASRTQGSCSTGGSVGTERGLWRRFLFLLRQRHLISSRFFSRAAAPSTPGRVNQNYATRYHTVAAYISLCTAAADNPHRRHDLRDSMRSNQYQRQFET